jgi:hypothetical protein
VRVEDPDIVKRFGIDHYYELYLFTDDSQGNPLVFCVRDLPEDMPTGDGPRYGESVRVAGFFLKSWSYRPGAGSDGQRPGNARQLAPLLVGREPVWYPPPGTSSTTLVGAVAGAAFLLVLLGVWLVAWRYDRGDRRFRRRIRERHDQGEGVVSPEELNNGESSP